VAVKLGSARIDENGNTSGGVAGDQNTKEVSTQSWYKHAKGWRVLRPNDANKAEKIAYAMQAACDNNKIGYDHHHRTTLYEKAKDVGFDPAKVTSNCETDCSALVRVCCAYAGITVANFYTENLVTKLLGTGEFTEMCGTKYTDKSDYLCRGDVLVTKERGHTVVVLRDGSKATARATTGGDTSTVNLNVTYTFGSRTMSYGMNGTDVRELQSKLTSLGYDCGIATGIFDTQTLASVKSFQQNHNIAADGNVTSVVCTLIDKLLADGSKKATASNTVTILSGDKPSVDENELVVAIQSKEKTVKTSRTTSGNRITDTSTTTQKVYYPPIEGDVTWDTERSGSPGKVTFNVRGETPFTEGDIVSLTYGKSKVFLGYIFSMEADKSGATSITAYDQTRYFKNQDTYVFSNKTASEMLRQIANDYKMPAGTIENTSIAIKSFVAEDKSLFDIIGDALDATISQSKKIFILYDDYGKITLKSANSMLVNLLLCEDTVGDYSYSSSIDEETYNQVILYYDNKDNNKREYFSATSSASVEQWGLLRKTESVNTSKGAQSLAEAYLKTYNKKVRKLSVSDAFGRCDIRAGTVLPVMMKVGDVNIKNFMMVEKASHKWSNGKHVMDLDLSGAGEFSV
jgi:peptidoglycan hydrolase-like protein with peptidoglycan-binding domain